MFSGQSFWVQNSTKSEDISFKDLLVNWNANKSNSSQQPTPIQCPHCGKMYKHKRSLWLHKKYECGKEPQFCCPFCPLSRRFTQKHNLDSHIRKHHSVLVNTNIPQNAQQF